VEGEKDGDRGEEGGEAREAGEEVTSFVHGACTCLLGDQILDVGVGGVPAIADGDGSAKEKFSRTAEKVVQRVGEVHVAAGARPNAAHVGI